MIILVIMIMPKWAIGYFLCVLRTADPKGTGTLMNRTF